MLLSRCVFCVFAGAGLAQAKDPEVAVLWSLCVPGGGQFYNNDLGKGALLFVGEHGLRAAARQEEREVTTRIEKKEHGELAAEETTTPKVTKGSNEARLFRTLAWGVRLYSIFDAYHVAKDGRRSRAVGVELFRGSF